ncbi:hypothetical protein [Ruminococcus sp.]|uniref:hypothetical protein n=1 Tax=Ruminococcus sp. TaxID=41978 RepID=UPI002588173E|nr:hypothetical protein [Ruminococcus sp.]MCR5020828.1 hypothetical protein [Ruminococcus sp.]
MENPIIEGQSLKTIESNIQTEIGKHEFWGDLELSFDELEILRGRLKSVLDVNSVTISYICRNYPHAFITYMVFFVRYRYDYNFWGTLSDDLGIDISPNMYSEIGSCAKRMFSKYSMDFSDAKDEAHKNIAPIIYEACLPPESSLDDLFYVMSYDANKVFDPQVIIEDLLDMRSYMIRKPLYRFLKRFKEDRAIDFVLEVRDAMISANQRNSKASRYVGNYTEWKEQEKNKSTISNRKKQEFQTRPYLFFDIGNKGLCIILPRVIMDNEWIDGVAWEIKGKNGLDKSVYCNVLGDEGIRYTDSITVAISPSDKYIISLINTEGIEEKPEKQWEIDGVSKDKIMSFNSNGRLVNSNHILFPYGILVMPEETKIVESSSLEIVDQYYPTNSSDFRIIAVTPLNNTASLKYSLSGNSYSLLAKPQINMFLEGQTLFGLSDTNVYTKIPKIKILVDGNISSLGLELRIGSVAYPVNINNTKENIYDIGKIAASELTHYGTYSIRLYQMGRFVKQVEFSFVPKIKTNYSPLIQWPGLEQRHVKKKYKFKIVDEWELIFEDCIVSNDGEHYIVTVPSHLGSVKTSLKSMKEDFTFSCELDLPVHPVEAEILDGEGNVIDNTTDRLYKADIDWLLESEKWLSLRAFGEYIGKDFAVQLKTANGVEQIEKMNLVRNGAGNFNLSVFNDTLRNCPLPAELEIICDNDENQTMAIVLITEKLSMESQVKFVMGKKRHYVTLDVADDGKDIDIVRYGFNSNEVHIPYSESLLAKDGKTRGYPYPGKLREGVYIVYGSRKQKIFDFEEENSLELCSGNNILIVSCRSKDKKTINTIKEWLDLLVIQANINTQDADLLLSGAVKIMQSTHELDDLESISFDDVDIEKLVALACFVDSKIVNTKKEILRKCMRLISNKFLQRGDRYRIIELLMELNAPQNVFDICMKEYALMLFYCDKAGAKELAAKVENYSIELSMLLLMSVDASVRDCIWREKYRDLIGRDAVRKLLSVPNENDPSVVALEQKKFMREIQGCRVQINLDDEITGNVESIQGMFVYDPKRIIFDLSKKPDYGVYFGRIRFVDQYVNWFKKTHDKKGNMYDEIRKLMTDVVKKNNDGIMKAFATLSEDPKLSKMSRQYMSAINVRCERRASLISYLKFFQLQGLAAFLTRLPMDRTDLDELRIIGIRFMEAAFIIAPRLSERDILMAETYIYLMRKEEKLCQ